MHENYFIDIEHIVKNLCMMSNKFLNAMLEKNIPATEKMLRVIMKNDKIKVISVQVQNFIQNLYGHSAQLDILAEDENGRRFNVEIQRADEGAQAKRARFYSSALDTVFLNAGHDYEELPESYVIFITENDVLNYNLPIYNIERTIKQNNTDFNDGSHIIYVNSQIQDDTPLGKLMQDMYCTDPAKLNYKEFAPKMEFLKYSKEGEKEMTDIFDFYIKKYGEALAESKVQEAVQEAERKAEQKVREAEQKAEQKVQEATEKTARESAHKENMSIATNLLNSGMSAEFIAQNTKLSIDEVRELAAKLSA